MKKKLGALLLAITISFAGTFAPQTSQYRVNAAEPINVGDAVDIIQIIVDIACPETPKKVCKGGSCEQVLGQSLTYKQDDYKLMKIKPANSGLLPIGWQGMNFQLGFLPFGTLLFLFAKVIPIGINGLYRSAFGK